tara:strand:+ start:1611 stop:1847 length:237 start_codon:yes stop_codon:yes gene_type:complete
MDEKKKKTSWFTFGWGHAHIVDERTYDKDVIVKITAEDPRARMIELFGLKWGFEYDEEPDLEHIKDVFGKHQTLVDLS